MAPGDDLHNGEDPFNNLDSLAMIGQYAAYQYLQGIIGGGWFYDEKGERINWPSSNGAWDMGTLRVQKDYNSSSSFHQGKHDNQWKPWHRSGSDANENAEIQAFCNKLETPGSDFKFVNDPTNTVYRIKSVQKKRLYNHTPWRARYIWDGTTSYPTPEWVNAYCDSCSTSNLPNQWTWAGYTAASSCSDFPSKFLCEHTIWGSGSYVGGGSGTWNYTSGNQGLVRAGDSVEEYAVKWAKGTTGNEGYNNSTDARDFVDAYIRFGKANNRRLCYIIEVDKDPTINAQYNPIDGSTLDANTSAGIEFVDVDLDAVQDTLVTNPAIWETEPRETADLDIYYEASQAYPININKNNRELYAPVGCRIEVVNEPQATDGLYDLTANTYYLKSWQDDPTYGDRLFYISGDGLNVKNSSGSIIDYENVRFRFY